LKVGKPTQLSTKSLETTILDRGDFDGGKIDNPPSTNQKAVCKATTIQEKSVLPPKPTKTKSVGEEKANIKQTVNPIAIGGTLIIRPLTVFYATS